MQGKIEPKVAGILERKTKRFTSLCCTHPRPDPKYRSLKPFLNLNLDHNLNLFLYFFSMSAPVKKKIKIKITIKIKKNRLSERYCP